MVDLNDLFAVADFGWELVRARVINDDGQIVAIGLSLQPPAVGAFILGLLPAEGKHELYAPLLLGESGA